MDREKAIKATEYYIHRKFGVPPMDVYRSIGRDKYEKIFTNHYKRF